MAFAVRVGDTTNHGGTVIGPGNATVLIGGKPSTVLGDMHICSLPPNGHQPTASPFILGSSTVLIGNMPAVRTSDSCICGAMPVVGNPTVIIG